MNKECLDDFATKTPEELAVIANEYFMQENDLAIDYYLEVYAWNPEDARILNSIGKCYEEGFGRIADAEKAISFYKRAAAMGYTDYVYHLALLLKKNGKPDCGEWLEKAYELGNYEAAHDMYVLALERSEYSPKIEAVIPYLDGALNQGFRLAAFDLGELYLQKDWEGFCPERGNAYMLEAAMAGNPIACHRLSTSYMNGLGLPVNLRLADEWARTAAALGDSDCLVELADALILGRLPVDTLNGEPEARALELYQYAAAYGNEAAKKRLSSETRNGEDAGETAEAGDGRKEAGADALAGADDGNKEPAAGNESAVDADADPVNNSEATEQISGSISEAMDTSIDNAYKAKEAENAENPMDLANRVLSGSPSVQDIIEAIEAVETLIPGAGYFNGEGQFTPEYDFLDCIYKSDKVKAVSTDILEYNLGRADMDNAEALYRVGRACKTGDWMGHRVEYIDYLLKAAERGHAQAMACLGEYYHHRGYEAKLAYKYLQMASEAGCAESCLYLGEILLEGGGGIEPDTEQAVKLISRAAACGVKGAAEKLDMIGAVANE